MIALLDVNYLIALFDAAHVHHWQAHAWLIQNRSAGWATCPLTENGCVRILALASYPGRLTVTDAVRRLAQATAASDHLFWPDDISICDAARFDPTRMAGAAQITDLYLLALAARHGGRLVTFDRGIKTAPVLGAASRNLVLL